MLRLTARTDWPQIFAIAGRSNQARARKLQGRECRADLADQVDAVAVAFGPRPVNWQNKALFARHSETSKISWPPAFPSLPSRTASQGRVSAALCQPCPRVKGS